MNQGNWKRFWTWCQKVFGAGWIHFATYNLMRVYGLENVHALSPERPDPAGRKPSFVFRHVYRVDGALPQYEVAQATFLSRARRFFYQGPLGLFVNLVMGWWSMYPPFFASGEKPMLEKRAFDKYSFALLTRLCRRGRGQCYRFSPGRHAQQKFRSIFISAGAARRRQVD